MPIPEGVESVPGAQDLYRWFGYWPDFHDAVVLKLNLNLGSPSTMLVHTWETTNQVDAAGFFELTKHVMVEFVMGGVTRLDLQDPLEHSILFDLVIRTADTGFNLDLSSSYGLSGTIDATELSLRLIPGQPPANGDFST